jgi:hypothetical protein
MSFVEAFGHRLASLPQFQGLCTLSGEHFLLLLLLTGKE